MSSPAGPSKDEGAAGPNQSPPTAQNADAIVTIFLKITIKHMFTNNKYEELLTKIESTFITIMNGVLKKYSHHVAGLLKVLLECPICKELLIKALTRKCGHSFCSHCFMQWFQNSNDCPICRNGVAIAAKNGLIDGVIHLLIESSFTTEEKRERVQRIQQRSAAIAAPQNDNDDGLSDGAISTESVLSGDELNYHENTLVALGRTDCVKQANGLLREIFTTTSLFSALQENEQDYHAVVGLFLSFCNDVKFLNQALSDLTI